MVTLLLAASAAVVAATPASGDCAALLPQAITPTTVISAMEATDLVRLRDIGDPSDRLDLDSPLAISPDGRQVTFILRRADPGRNSYCQGLILVDLDGVSPPRLLDDAGDVIRVRFPLTGLDLPESGVPAVIPPRWSPDGRMIAYVRRTGGRTIARLVSINSAPPVTQDLIPNGDVEDLAWSPDGQHLFLSLRGQDGAGAAALAREASSGYLFDDRFRPIASSRPFLPSTGASRSEIWPVMRDGRASHDGGLTQGTVSPEWDFASQLPQNGSVFTEPDPTMPGRRALRIVLRIGQRRHICPDDACRGGIVGLWIRPAPKDLLYLRREGAAGDGLALYRWSPGRAPKRVVATDGLLIGCEPAARGDLICLEESSLQPRRLVRVDTERGEVTELFDPNPEWQTLTIGSAQRLHWTDRYGRPNFGDLVLPPSHRPGERHPMILVQYVSRGFLRGGTGDEFPIQLFANQGFAVLSFQYPSNSGPASGPRDLPPLEDDRDPRVWRRNVQASLEAGVASAVATGTVDPERLGISGLSDGATSAAWALINSKLFRVASISSCCMDEAASLVVGPAYVAGLKVDGYPTHAAPDPAFWRAGSLAANAEPLDAPILMQLSDDEYLHGLPAWFALKSRKKPVAMFVFPDERHIKWQPAHRLAIYQRNLDWFSFWLKGRDRLGAGQDDLFQRWERLGEQARE